MSSPTPTSTTSSPSSSSTQQSIDYLSYLGSLSSLPFNPNTVINALLQADQIPITTLQSQISSIQSNAATYQNIASDVSALQSAQFALTLQSVTQAKAVTSSNSAVVAAVAAPSVQAGTYSVLVNSVASATTARSTGSIGQAIDSVASTTPLSALNLNGTPTAGIFSVVVDGKVNSITVDPSKALLDPSGGALSLLQSALTQSLAGDTGATTTVSVSNDRVNIGISGATSAHTISFGAAGDTSNFLSLMGLSTTQGSTTNGSLVLSSSTAVGVAQAASSLSSAGLSTALSTSTGAFTINGTSISWDSSQDSLNTIIGKINNSSSGVIASYDSQSDRLVLTSKTTGQAAISLADTSGNFLSAMQLAPGTTMAQTLGANASITVNGSTVTSPSNTITTAVSGLSINALAQTTGGNAVTLTVTPDVTGMTKSVQTFVDAVNKVLTDINATQQQSSTGTYGPLLGDPVLTGLQNHLLTTILDQVTNSGTYQSLQDIGITTGTIGSTPGSTTSLSLDTTKLSAALNANPGQVAALFSGTTSANGFVGVAQQLETYLQPETNPITGPFAQEQASVTAQVKQLQTRVTTLQSNMTQKRAMLTAQFTALSTLYNNLAAESAIFSASASSSSASSSSGSSSSTTTGG